MKARTLFTLLSLLPAFAIEIPRVTAAPADPPKLIESVFVSPESPELGDVKSLADRAINRLAYSLVSEAGTAVAKQGASAALAVCHLKFVPQTGDVIHDMPRVTGYKRTSLRIRDAANAPDEAEKLALERVKRDIDEGNSPPRMLAQRVLWSNRVSEWRVYRPIGVMAQCVTCHGPTSGMPDDLRTELSRRYPEDQATGYNVGEWRGLIRVSIAPATAPAAAPAKK